MPRWTDRTRRAARRLIESTTEPIVIPSPVLVEAAYFIERRLHPNSLYALLNDIAFGAYAVEDLRPADYERARPLCEQYEDSRIGFVDAAVLAIVERLNEPKLATLDHRHFGMMRPRHVETLRLLPD